MVLTLGIMSGKHPNRLQQADDRAHDVVQQALDEGHLESGEPFLISPMPTHTIANDARLSVGRALVHFNLSRTAWVVDGDGEPCYRDCKDENAPHGVKFRLFSKNAGRRHIVQQAGGDPSKLKYNPFEKRKTTAFDDDGKPPAHS